MPGLIVYRWAFFHLLYISTLHIPDVGPKFARAPGHRSSCPRPKLPCQHPTKRVRSDRMHPGPFYFTPNTRHTHIHTVTSADRDPLHFLPIRYRPNLPPHTRHRRSVPCGLASLLHLYLCGCPVPHGRRAVLTIALSSPPPLGSIHIAASAS
jgi:hypothetical protein